MAKKYQIDLQINTSQADAAAARAVKEQAKIADAALKAAAAAERAQERIAAGAARTADREAAMRQRVGDRLLAAENARGVASEKAKAALAASALKAGERDAAQRLKLGDRLVTREHARGVASEKAKLALAAQTEKAKSDMAEQGAAAFTRMAVGGAAFLAQQIAAAFGQVTEAAAAKMQAVSDKFTGTRDSVRELANLSGEQADSPEFLKGFASFGRATGMKPAEQVSYRTQLLNSGAQFIGDEAGKNMGTAESKQFAEQSGALAIARGADPDVAGDLAGRVLGTTDFKKFGDRGSEMALGRFNAPLAILDAGVGKSSQLMNQFNMLLGTAYNEDEAKGAFSDLEEMATVISTQAQKNVGRSFTGVRAAMKGVRDFDNPLVQKAKITPMTTFPDAMRLLAPVIQEEATAKGVKPVDIVNEAFEDDLTAEGILTQTEQGVNQGLYAKRAAVGAASRGPEAGLAKIAEFKKTGTFLDREADAFNEQVDIEKGMRSADVNVLRKQSIGELRRDKKLDTTGSEFQKYLLGKAGFGALPDRDRSMVDSHVLGMLSRRGDKGLYSYGGELGFPGVKGYTPEDREEYLNERIGAAKAGGRDPFHDMAASMKENTEVMRENNQLMRHQGAGGVRSSLPDSAPPPVLRR